MKRRVLQIHHLGEKQLKYLLTRVQWLCRKDTREFLLGHERDWYIILRVLCDLGIIIYDNRIPFAAFVRWIEEHKVPPYHHAPQTKQLRYQAQRVADAEYPWLSKHAAKYYKKAWELLYWHFTKMVREAFEHSDKG